ncbi:MAG: serine/threonine-protein kinase [Cyanobacteriota bacterium]|nr:serine/threonine-protein kinase [Cyanobacteriota bacterium]
MMSSVSEKLINHRYRLMERLAMRESSSVFAAVDTHLYDTPVAIKLFHNRMTASAESRAHLQKRLASETRVGILLGRHPHIIQVKECGLDQDQLYMVMELLSSPPLLGSTLAELLHKEGSLPPERAVTLGLQMCAGLQFAHTLPLELEDAHFSGLLHQDIQPANLFVIRDSSLTETMKILDFGISQRLAALPQPSQRPSQELNPRLLPYASPEQMRGVPLDVRSDIYSLGVVFYEMLTGELPFLAKEPSFPGWYFAHHNFLPRPFAHLDLRYSLPERLQTIVLACLEKDPHNRPSSMQMVQEHLQVALLSTAYPRALAPVGQSPVPPATPSEPALDTRRLPDFPQPTAAIPTATSTVSPPPLGYPGKSPRSTPSKSSANPTYGWLTGMAATLAVGIPLLLGFWLVNRWQQQQTTLRELAILQRMVEDIQAGEFQDCLEVNPPIPEKSVNFTEFQRLTEECQIARDDGEFQKAQALLNQGEWRQAAQQASRIANHSLLAPAALKIIDQAASQLLQQAQQAYQQGNLQQAQTLVKGIPSQSSLYAASQAQLQEWQTLWQADEQRLQQAQQQIAQRQWQAAITTLEQLSDTSYRRQQKAPLLQQAQKGNQPTPLPVAQPATLTTTPTNPSTAPAPPPTRSGEVRCYNKQGTLYYEGPAWGLTARELAEACR